MHVAFLCSEIGQETQAAIAEPVCLSCISLNRAHSVQLAAKIISLQAV